MMPPSELATVAPLLAAISEMLRTSEPAFVGMAQRAMIPIAVLLVGTLGVRIMFTTGTDSFYSVVRLVFALTLNLMLLRYYDTPLPGFGVTFGGLIASQGMALANVLDARALDNVVRHIDEIWRRVIVPNPWAVVQLVMYVAMLCAVAVAKAVALGVVAWSLIALAICTLLGPLFVTTLLVPKLDWLFWGWVRATVGYALTAPVVFAYLLLAERFMYAWLTTMPDVVDLANSGAYALSTIAVLVAFAVGLLKVPSIATSLVSGSAASSFSPGVLLRPVATK